MNFIEACRKFISIDSTSVNGNNEMAKFVGLYCQSLGFEVEYHPDTVGGVEQMNLVIRLPGAMGEEELMLQSHLDTTDPGAYAMWTQTQENPFNATIYEGRIFGLGSADVKLDMLCKIKAAESFLDKKLKKPFVIVGTYGEENGMAGAIKLIRRKKVKARRALIGEPTELSLGHAGPGVAVVEASVPFTEEEKQFRAEHDLLESSSSQSRFFYGKAAHSSHPALGENAIIKMLDYLANLPDGIAVLDLDGGTTYSSVPSSSVLEFDVVGNLRETVVQKLHAITEAMKSVESEFAQYPDAGFAPETPTLNLGLIRTYEDHVRLVGSCRTLPSVPQEVAESWIERLRGACLAVGASFRIADYKQPFQSAETSAFVKGCQHELKAMGLNSELSKISSCTEASVFGRLGVECLVFGPGQGIGNSHAPNEHISLEELEKAMEFYRRVIERFCL